MKRAATEEPPHLTLANAAARRRAQNGKRERNRKREQRHEQTQHDEARNHRRQRRWLEQGIEPAAVRRAKSGRRHPSSSPTRRGAR